MMAKEVQESLVTVIETLARGKQTLHIVKTAPTAHDVLLMLKRGKEFLDSATYDATAEQLRITFSALETMRETAQLALEDLHVAIEAFKHAEGIDNVA